MEPLNAGANLHALQALSMEALKDSLQAQEMAATLVTQQPLDSIAPEYLGRNIDFSA